MNQYIQTVLDEKYNTDKRIKETIATKTGVIPRVNDPTKTLSLIEESIIKLIYLHKVFFLEEIFETFIFAYTQNQLEEILIRLEEQKYVISKKDKDLGKCFVLTKQSIYFIKYNPNFIKVDIRNVCINDDKFSQNLIKYKCISSLTSNYVLYVMAFKLHKDFFDAPKEIRKKYTRIQYLKHILFKRFLKCDMQDRILLLNELSFPDDEIERFCSIQRFTEEIAQFFAEQYLKEKGDSYLDSQKEYITFKRTVLYYCLHEETRSNKFLYAFLKDFQSNKDKNYIISEIMGLVLIRLNNYMRTAEPRLLNYFYKTNNRDIYKWQILLYSLLEKKEIEKRNYQKLIQVNTKTINTDKLEAINQNIKELYQDIESINLSINRFYRYFEFLKYDRTDENDIMRFKEEKITLSKLAEKGVYISAIQKGEYKNRIVFSIVQTRISGFSFQSLFDKLVSSYLIWLNIFNLDYELIIQICVHGEIMKQDIIQTVEKVKKLMHENPEYRFLHSIFDDIVIINNCENKNLERYEVYNIIRDEINNLS